MRKNKEIILIRIKYVRALIKVSKQKTPIYYQFCPMANNGKELVKVKKIQLKSVLWFNDA
jgi:hypothetical protein